MPSVLIVEDDKLLGKALKNSFAGAGFDAVWVQDGIQALTAAKNTKFDVIYLDIVLPGMDGYETLKALKNDPGTKDIPVIMLSNLGEHGEINRALELGATDFVVKVNTDLQSLVNITKSKYS